MNSVRFTDPNKWDDPWFDALPPWGKLLWLYAVDRCDHVGYLSLSTAQAERRIPGIVWESVRTLFHGRLDQVGPDAWILPKFLHFQQPRLASNKNMLVAVNRLLEKHNLSYSDGVVRGLGHSPSEMNIEAPTKPLPSPLVPPQVEVQVKVQDKVLGGLGDSPQARPRHYAAFEEKYDTKLLRFEDTPEGQEAVAFRRRLQARTKS